MSIYNESVVTYNQAKHLLMIYNTSFFLLIQHDFYLWR